MNDFIDALEDELVAASRRRAAGARPLRRRPRLRAVLAVAVAAAALAVAAAVLIGREPAPDERPAAPDGSWMGITVGGELAAPCGDATDTPRADAPQALRDEFVTLRRDQGESDPLPELNYDGGPYTPGQWLPVGAYDPAAVRRIGATTQGRAVHVVPTPVLTPEPLPCKPGADPRGPGVCLVFGDAGEPLLWRCFTQAEALAGRAWMVGDRTSAGARLVGFVPDGVAAVSVDAGGRQVRIGVADNLAMRYLDIPADGRIRVRLERSRPQCAPTASPAVLRSVAAFGTGAAGSPPPQVDAAREGGRIDAQTARLLAEGGGVAWWLVAASWPQDDACAPPDRACVVPVVASGYGGVPACTRPRHLPFRWTVIAGPILDSRVSVFGVVPPRVAEARVTAGGERATVVARDGVLAAVLPRAARWRDTGGVRIRYVPAPDAPRVALRRAPRLAPSLLGRLHRAAFNISDVIEGGPPIARTKVLYAPGHREDAEAVRRLLRVHRIAAADRELTGDVVVVVGEDLASRMR